LATRDGQQDTRLAAERGIKTAYPRKDKGCDDDAEDDPAADSSPAVKTTPGMGAAAQTGASKPQ